jgi:hypothetical protein
MPFRPDSVTIHPDAQPLYDSIEGAARKGRSPEKAIWKSFQVSVSRAKADGQFGEVVPCTARFRRKYGATNLYCIDLAGWRRCFYTILDRDVIFLDIVNHAEYDRWFPNKGK